ncbi:MAG: SRPBCC domain-containing protein [Phycisphaeraceae bacterium]|nr:MAG: SRPBCC domain-containing protein [Phycisphaeraceae bacterium]
MPVRKDDEGRRYVEAEVEIPGSPEEVWRAIATGEGISSWFVPSKVEGRVGGQTVTSFGPGMDAVSKITKWNPPQSYTAESEEGDGETGPGKVATEWIVEARDRGTCIVRVVHRWFADTDDWDGQFEGHAYGWATSFFRMLKLYQSNFPGQKCSAFQLAAISQAPPPETWRTFKIAMKIDEQSGRAASTPGAPEFAGAVERMEITDPELQRIRKTSPHVAAALESMEEGEEPELLLRLDRPAPGLAHIFVVPLGGPTMVSMRVHLYGENADAAAAEAERAWSGWLNERFPQPAEKGSQ